MEVCVVAEGMIYYRKTENSCAFRILSLEEIENNAKQQQTS